MFFQDFRRLRVFLWMLWLVMLVLWCGVFAYAQTPDLDLVTERSLGVSVSALEGAEFRSGLLVAPWQLINGGVFVYGTQSVVEGEAVEAAIQWRVDLRKQCQLLTNANAALTTKKEKLLKERNEFREGLKVIAKSLGVPDTASHCVQRIAEIEQALETATDKVSVVKCDRNAYKASRDRFKAKYEASVSDLAVVKSKLLAYQCQGFWGRVFRRVPVVVPYAEPVDG